MAIISTANAELPSPATYKIDTEPLGSFERNANGDMVGDIIAFKTKISCTWKCLTGAQVAAIKTVHYPFFQEITFLSDDGKTLTKTMYASPISVTSVLLKNGVLYSDVSCNFVER
jgi:hypothetical protein